MMSAKVGTTEDAAGVSLVEGGGSEESAAVTSAEVRAVEDQVCFCFGSPLGDCFFESWYERNEETRSDSLSRKRVMSNISLLWRNTGATAICGPSGSLFLFRQSPKGLLL
jgi:hypothetical protein